MSKLSWNEHLNSKHPWNNRIAVIPNSIVTNDITTEEMTRQMLRLYRKVIDSNAWIMMTDHAKTAENVLLRIGISHDPQSETMTDEQAEAINQLDEESWRKIMIHADEEGVLEPVMRAIELQQFHAPTLDIQQIERFTPRIQKSLGPLDREKLLDHSLKTKFKFLWHDYGECPELDICRMTANAAYEMKKATLSRRHLADIYEVFKYEDFDEDKYAKMTKDADLYGFVVKLQTTLEEMLGLTEGFMPLPVQPVLLRLVQPVGRLPAPALLLGQQGHHALAFEGLLALYQHVGPIPPILLNAVAAFPDGFRLIPDTPAGLQKAVRAVKNRFPALIVSPAVSILQNAL